MARVHRIQIALSIVALLAVLGVISYFSLTRPLTLIDQPSLVLGHEIPSMDECLEKHLADESVPYQAKDVGSDANNEVDVRNNNVSHHLQVAINDCYKLLHSQGLLNDFQIRRAKFAIQYRSEKVVLWMVVILTLSGVALAALQLAAAYALAKATGSDSLQDQQEFSVEKGKIVLRSSITGLFILLISFAFFYVYILHVYTIKELGSLDAGNGTNANLHQDQGTLTGKLQGFRGELSPKSDQSQKTLSSDENRGSKENASPAEQQE
jgi:lysylphosphatidylglycerol synthetase-like protein (DUF2156 family)